MARVLSYQTLQRWSLVVGFQIHTHILNSPDIHPRWQQFLKTYGPKASLNDTMSWNIKCSCADKLFNTYVYLNLFRDICNYFTNFCRICKLGMHKQIWSEDLHCKHFDNSNQTLPEVSMSLNKGNKKLGFVRRNIKDCTKPVKSATCTAMVWSAVKYACTVWDPSNQKRSNP